ncbi:30S ribosomal protein S21, chloroplastic [Capsicum galapagoense]
MAVSSIGNLFSLFTPSKPPPPPPKSPSLQFTTTHSRPKLVSSSDSDVTSVVCPSLAYANTLYFRSAYNVQVIVDDNEPEEKLLGRFRREVMKAGVIQECKRRRFFENKQDKDKRKSREAARRNRRRRGPPPGRNFGPDKQETTKSKRDDDDDDNWELPEGGGISN